MAKKLVIVESPAKAKTIGKILGTGYTVKSSVGHIRDLPERSLGVDVKNEFAPKYVLSKGKTKVLAELRKAAKNCEAIYLAPDPDREGEAIAWHLYELLAEDANETPFHRVQYNEITPRAVRAALEQPGEINMDRVDAQQARRVLDRIVGYKVSPLVWRRIRKGLSAGRVQSVALRLLAEREREIQAFVPQKYWVMGANVKRQTPPPDPFAIRLAALNGEKPDIKSAELAGDIMSDLKECSLVVSEVKVREVARRPLPPFITSTLQQAASSVLGFSPGRTMRIAQNLYEGIDFGDGSPIGLITYMRTDSVFVARDAQESTRAFITTQYGTQYCPDKPNFYRSRSGAQEAHEAVRPTDPTRTPESLKGLLDPPSLKLYDLIWRRFVASQMNPARVEQRRVEIVPEKRNMRFEFLFSASASQIIFDGFLRVMALKLQKTDLDGDNSSDENDEVATLPPLAPGDPLDVLEWLCDEKETKPPSRYSEASLIKTLEANGVGRPSTYSSIIDTLNTRDYSSREKRQLIPTELGLEVNDLLVATLPQLFDVGFTAKMEEQLDLIEAGKVKWVSIMSNFYDQFQDWMKNTKEPPAENIRVNSILQLFEHVKTWVPEVRRGKRLYSDERFVASVAKQLEKSDVSERQCTALAKIALRYRDQIPNLDSRLINLGFDALLEEDREAPATVESERRFKLVDTLELTESQAAFVSSLRQHAAGGRKLSARQLNALDRVIIQNAHQIENFNQVKQDLGIEIQSAEGEPDPEIPLIFTMLENVTQWQEPIKRGKRVFDDYAFYQSVLSQYEMKLTLSPRQRYALRRMLIRYKEQIPGYEKHAATLGLVEKEEKKPKE